MKQHITTEQVFELETFDSFGFENWDKICKLNTIADVQFNVHCQTFRECCYQTARQMTIGKMIEILNIGYMEFDICDDTWLIGESLSECHSNNIPRSDKKELCDALWEVVKFKLK